VAAVLPSLADLKGFQILVIEDDALGKEGLASLLESWGCRVTAVDSALAACKLFRHQPHPDFIISDYRLRDGLNGIDAVNQVRDTCGRQIAACLMSGDIGMDVRIQAQAAGLTLLHKPVRPAKLSSLLRNWARENLAQ
jgi:CheY-like chemotaxis protein